MCSLWLENRKHDKDRHQSPHVEDTLIGRDIAQRHDTCCQGMWKSPRFQKACKNLSATRADSEALQTQTPGISSLNTSPMALLNTEKCQDLRMAPLLAWLFVSLSGQLQIRNWDRQGNTVVCPWSYQNSLAKRSSDYRQSLPWWLQWRDIAPWYQNMSKSILQVPAIKKLQFRWLNFFLFSHHHNRVLCLDTSHLISVLIFYNEVLAPSSRGLLDAASFCNSIIHQQARCYRIQHCCHHWCKFDSQAFEQLDTYTIVVYSSLPRMVEPPVVVAVLSLPWLPLPHLQPLSQVTRKKLLLSPVLSPLLSPRALLLSLAPTPRFLELRVLVSLHPHSSAQLQSQ